MSADDRAHWLLFRAHKDPNLEFSEHLVDKAGLIRHTVQLIRDERIDEKHRRIILKHRRAVMKAAKLAMAGFYYGESIDPKLKAQTLTVEALSDFQKLCRELPAFQKLVRNLLSTAADLQESRPVPFTTENEVADLISAAANVEVALKGFIATTDRISKPVDAGASGLAVRGSGASPYYGEQRVVWILLDLCEHLGLPASYSKSNFRGRGPFERFVDGWWDVIAPHRSGNPPKRSFIRDMWRFRKKTYAEWSAET